MTRWLQAAKMASGVFDTTDTTDKTPQVVTPERLETECHNREPRIVEVLSVVSVVSKGGKADFRNGEGTQSSPLPHDDESLQMEFEERAAILEFDAGFSRREAEERARLEICSSGRADGGSQ